MDFYAMTWKYFIVCYYLGLIFLTSWEWEPRRQVAPLSPSDLTKDTTRVDAKQRYLFKVLLQVVKTQC